MTTNNSRATYARTPKGDDGLDELLIAVAQGDDLAFSELYDRLGRRVLGCIRRLLIDPAQSEEVAQEVFLELWQSAPRYQRSKAGAAAWALNIARQRAIDRVRSEQAARDRDNRVGLRDYQPWSDDVAEAVERSFDGARLKAALQQLPAPQRQAISLTYYDGYSQSEVARLLRVPIGTVKTRQRNAIHRLRGELASA